MNAASLKQYANSHQQLLWLRLASFTIYRSDSSYQYLHGIIIATTRSFSNHDTNNRGLLRLTDDEVHGASKAQKRLVYEKQTLILKPGVP